MRLHRTGFIQLFVVNKNLTVDALLISPSTYNLLPAVLTLYNTLFWGIYFRMKPDDGHCSPKRIVFIYKNTFISHTLVVLLTVVTPT